MKLKQLITTGIFAALLLCSTSMMFGQDGAKKIRSMKVGFLTEKLSLTAEEAELFWPVYNKYQDRKDEIRAQYKKASLSDADAHIKKQEAELMLDKEYNALFKKVLAAEKVLLLHQAEREWTKILLQEVRKRKNKDE